MASSMEEQSLDLTTCCVCFESFDLNEHKPKYLPCSHTLCLICLKGIRRDRQNCVACPVCKNKLKLPVTAVESLPNNLHAIHIIKLENERKDGQSWCLTCEALVKPNCLEAKHQTRGFKEEVEECQTVLDEVLKGYETGDVMRGRVDGVLQAKLKAIEAHIAENNNGRKKIQSAIASCREIAKLSPGMKVSNVIRKKIKQMKKEMKDEVDRVKNLLDRVAPATRETAEQSIAGDASVTRKSVKRTAEEAAETSAGSSSREQDRLWDSRDAFVANCFSVQRKQSDVTSSFHCQELCQPDSVIAVEFSHDGTLLASGGHDKIVRLWPINSQAEIENPRNASVPIEMKKKHLNSVACLTFVQDNSRLFSGGLDGKIFIHDVQTKKLLNTFSIDALKYVVSFSLKPGSDGNVFATANRDHVLRVFDTRRSTAVVEDTNLVDIVNLWSVMFSPLNPWLIAVAGTNGTQILDIRNNRCVNSFGDPDEATVSARFDERGSRLLCRRARNLPVVYNVPITSSEQQQQPASRVTDKVQLTAQGYSTPSNGISNCCFAGGDDELVVASSSNHNLLIWSVPEGQGDRTINQPLLSLTGHRHAINCARYSKAVSSLASSDTDGIIKLWTPSPSSR